MGNPEIKTLWIYKEPSDNTWLKMEKYNAIKWTKEDGFIVNIVHYKNTPDWEIIETEKCIWYDLSLEEAKNLAGEITRYRDSKLLIQDRIKDLKWKMHELLGPLSDWNYAVEIQEYINDWNRSGYVVTELWEDRRPLKLSLLPSRKAIDHSRSP